MRTAYHEQMDVLTAELGDMCGLAGADMERATQALLQADLVLAEQVSTDHEQIAAMSAKAEESAFVLLALQAPVAGGLRAIVSSIQIVADVDRMGALALHVAKIARRRHPQHALPEEVNGYFAEMGRVAVELGNSAQEVLVTRDPEKAARIREEDDAMDDLHRHLFTVLMDREWKHGVAAAVDVTLLGRFYERFADHAVEVARRVIFQVTGKHPEEEVKKCIDLPVGRRGSEPVGKAVTVIDRDDAVRGEPVVVRRPGDAQHGGACALGKLDGDGAAPACRARDGNRVARLQRDRAHR